VLVVIKLMGADFELGFGVTSKVWDYIFSTVLQVATK